MFWFSAKKSAKSVSVITKQDGFVSLETASKFASNIFRRKEVKKNRSLSPSRLATGRAGFTLVELLIVIAILAILTAAVVIVLNPAEFINQGRDAKRVNDMKTVSSALSIYIVENPNASLGENQTVYTSLIDDLSATCSSHSLPALPTGWKYSCASSGDVRKTSGLGWVPINFESIKGGSPLPYLPIDQENSSSSGKYYIYIPDGWAIAATANSSRYLREVTPKDGGFDPIRFETGKDLSVIGLINQIVGIWDFNEGDGDSVYERGISGNDGTIFGDPQWTDGLSGSALLFDGMGDYVQVDNQTGDTFTISFWMKTSTLSSEGSVCTEGDGMITSDVVGVGNDFSITILNNHACFFTGNTEDSVEGSVSLIDDEWHNVVVSRERGALKKIFIDSVQDGGGSANNNILNSNLHIEFGGSTVTGKYFSGIIDNITIYNRILSDSEISSLYNSGLL